MAANEWNRHMGIPSGEHFSQWYRENRIALDDWLSIPKTTPEERQAARNAFDKILARSAEIGSRLFPYEASIKDFSTMTTHVVYDEFGAQSDQNNTTATTSIPRTGLIPDFSEMSQGAEGSRTSQASLPEAEIAINTKSPLLELPSELQLTILSFLDVATLNGTSYTCRHFHNIISPKMLMAADKSNLKRRVALMERSYRNWEPDYLVCYSCLTPQSPDSFSEDQKTGARKLHGSAAIRRRCIACLDFEQPGSGASAPTQFGYGTNMTLAQLLRAWKDPCQALPHSKIETTPPDPTWIRGYV
jgi:hypothetical protein